MLQPAAARYDEFSFKLEGGINLKVNLKMGSTRLDRRPGTQTVQIIIPNHPSILIIMFFTFVTYTGTEKGIQSI